jgi:hypothetical protein
MHVFGMTHGSYSRPLIAVKHKLSKPFVRSGKNYKTVSTYHSARTNIDRLVREVKQKNRDLDK